VHLVGFMFIYTKAIAFILRRGKYFFSSGRSHTRPLNKSCLGAKERTEILVCKNLGS
jgi:hypothetical protein